MKLVRLPVSLAGLMLAFAFFAPACGPKGADGSSGGCGAVVASCLKSGATATKKQCTDERGFTAAEVQFRNSQCDMSQGAGAAKTTPCDNTGANGACVFTGVPSGSDGDDGNTACTVAWYWRAKQSDIDSIANGCGSIGGKWCAGSACDGWR